MYLFGCLFAFLFLGIVLFFSIIRGFFQLLFGRGFRTRTFREGPSEQSSARRETDSSASSNPQAKKKLIGEDEGEYVEYEEVD